MLFDMVVSASDLGESIRALRRSRGLTQRRLAALSGTSPRLIIELEGGRATVGVGLVLRVLATLGADLAIITRDEGKARET